ncbi:MAG: 1-acyl-sn-glycerol-3-phosphate acyltransferase [Bdellovibrionota bacterium]
MEQDRVTESDTSAADISEPPAPPVDFIDWLLFPIFITAFAGSLLFFDPLQRIAIRFGVAAQQRVVIWLNYALCASLRLIGTKIEVQGEDKLPTDCSCIIVSNHQSMFDIPILSVLFRRHFPRFIAKKELSKGLPSVSFNLRRGGSAVIDRSDPRQAIPEIKRMGERLEQEHFAAVIFPEGTRARRGALKPFRPAGVSTLFQTAQRARVVPVAIDGAWKLACRSKGPIPRGIRVTVRILDELDRNGIHAKELVPRTEAIIRKGLAEIRGEAP